MGPVDTDSGDGHGADGGALRVEVALGLAPRVVQRISICLPPGSTVREALDAACVWSVDQSLDLASIASGAWTVGVWGRREALDHVLRDQDRIELVRGLKVDPKEARRVRYRAHGEKLPKGFQRGKAR